MRSARWIGKLGALPRGISPANLDWVFHCRLSPQRVVVFEIKRLNEEWQHGQLEMLQWFDGLERCTVRVLRGTPTDLYIERLSKPEGRYRIDGPGFHEALHDFLNGQPWRDPKEHHVQAPRELWPGGINPYVAPGRRAELEALRDAPPLPLAAGAEWDPFQ